jgi:hypothetical protein
MPEEGTEKRSIAPYKICKRESRHLIQSLCVSKAAWRCTPESGVSCCLALYSLTYIFLFFLSVAGFIFPLPGAYPWGAVHVVTYMHASPWQSHCPRASSPCLRNPSDRCLNMFSVSFRADLNARRVLWLVVAETLFGLDASVRTLDLEERWFFWIQRTS